MLDSFFKIKERGSTVGREIRGGFVTFFTMAYIVALNPLIIGGGQERGLRSGTEDVAAIVGFAKAAELALQYMPEESKRLRQLRDKAIKTVFETVPR